MAGKLLYIVVFTVTLLSTGFVYSQKVTWTIEASQDCDNGTSQDPTSVTTFNGSIYFIYVNPARQMVVAKKTGNVIQRVIVFDLEMGVDERFHICPTIGVDKKGYIHICGDMHNDVWKYYRSNNPEDISSWTRRYDLPGVSVTYPTIFYDNNREMYLCFRHRRDLTGLGNHRVGIAKYNADNNTFSMLGGVSYTDAGVPATTKTMAWSNGFGGNGCWYIKPCHRIYFDGNNRMHFVSPLMNVCIAAPYGYESNTHIIYAYSDDFGVTWRKAGGAAITTLPLTILNATVVLNRTAQHDIIGGNCELGAFSSDRPIISYKLFSDNTTHCLMWNGSTWVEIFPPKGNEYFVSRANGYTAWYDGLNISYTNDGANWTTLTGTPTAFPRGVFGSMGGIDREYFKQTGNFRYHGKFNNYTYSSIFTIYSNIGNEISSVESIKANAIISSELYQLFSTDGRSIGTFKGEFIHSNSLKQKGIRPGIYLAVPLNIKSNVKVSRVLVQ